MCFLGRTDFTNITLLNLLQVSWTDSNKRETGRITTQARSLRCEVYIYSASMLTFGTLL